MKVKIAVVQLKIKQYDPDHNIKRAEKFIKKASGKADIIVFPEDFITGPVSGKQELADFDGKYKLYFQKLAKKYRISIVPGSIIESENNKLYNTTYFIDCISSSVNTTSKSITCF